MAADDAHRRLCFLLFIFSLLLPCTSPAVSGRRRLPRRTLSPITTTTTTLNVSASLAQARRAGSFDIVNISTSGPPPTAPVETLLVHSPFIRTYRYVGMTGFSVGRKMLPFPPSTYELNEEAGTGGVIVDSGTTVTRLLPPVYTALRAAFRAGMKKLPAVGKRVITDTCYRLLGRGVVTVPTVGFHFPGGGGIGGGVEAAAEEFLGPDDSDGIHCFAFAPSSVPLSIIGNVQQQLIRVSFY